MDFFFERKLELSLNATLKILYFLIENETKIKHQIVKNASRLVNVHHIQNSEFLNKKAQSNLNDILPLEYLPKLCEDNFHSTHQFLNGEKNILNSYINLDSKGMQEFERQADYLYAILNENTYYRAQLELQLNELDLFFTQLNLNYRTET